MKHIFPVVINQKYYCCHILASEVLPLYNKKKMAGILPKEADCFLDVGTGGHLRVTVSVSKPPAAQRVPAFVMTAQIF